MYKVDPKTKRRSFQGMTTSLPLGMIYVNQNEEKKCDSYVNEIVELHLDEFGESFWDGDTDSFEHKIFKLLSGLKPSSAEETRLMKDIMRLLVTTYLLGYSLHIPEELKLDTIARLECYAGSHKLNQTDVCAPLLVNYQTKYLFRRIHQSTMNNILLKLQQILKSSQGTDKWMPCFCAFLGLAIALERQQSTLFLFASGEVDSDTGPNQVDKACREIDNKFMFMTQIFRWKYNRKINPLKEPPSLRELDPMGRVWKDADVMFVRNIANLVRENGR